MRIVGGKWGGRTLVAPKGDSVRPTSDKVREALFKILGDVEDAEVLDACAGTGAFALEALSRGARRALAIEQDPRALAVIDKNREALGASGLEVWRRALVPALAALGGQRFHVIFCDPPWRSVPALGRALLDAGGALLVPGGHLILEHAARTEPLAPGPHLSLRETRRYGDTALSFYDHDGAAP
jgi:16S rRNA (guanine966-N2)-methyltransferase